MPNIIKSKPTVEEILALYDDVKARYDESGLFTQFDTDELLYELEFKDLLLLPKEFSAESIVLPTARDLVDVCVDHTDLFNARVFTNRKGTSAKSEEEQNILRKFGLGIIHRNHVEASISPFRVAGKHYWLHGLGILKTVWDADRWIDKPEQEKGESEESYATKIEKWRADQHSAIPIVIQGIHPRNVMFDPYSVNPEFTFETNEELAFNVKHNFPVWSNPKARKIVDKVEHISFWSPNFRCELYDREPVLKVDGGVAEHSYGFIPYIPIDTGLGNISSTNDLKKRYVGILRYVKELLVSESRDYSLGDVILKKNAFPWGYLKGQNAQSVQQIFQKFGEFTPLPDGVDLVEMQPKMPPEALLTWMQVASTYLAGHAAPPSVRGMGESGVRSGSDRRQLIAEAVSRYQYSNEAFKNGISKVLSNCARIMKNVVPGNINVWARTPTDEFDVEIDKNKMTEPFTFYVEFAPISEEDEYRRHDDLERLVKSGLVTANWARTQMSNVDPQALEVDTEVERLKNDPMVQQIVSQYFAGQLMAALQKRSMAESLDNPPPTIPAAASGMTQPPNEGGLTGTAPAQNGRRLVPPSLSIVTPGSAEGLQRQMGQNRSQVPMNPTQGRGVGAGGNK